MRLLLASLFLFLGSLQALSGLDDYEDRIEEIRYAASQHLDRARLLGLVSPYARSTYGGGSWTELFVEDFQGYADFSLGFNYLVGWCDERASQAIAYQNECIASVLKGSKNNTGDKDVLYRQNIINRIQQKTPHIQTALQEGQSAIFQEFDRLYREVSFSNPSFLFHKGYFFFDQGKALESFLCMEKLLGSGKIAKVFKETTLEPQDFYLDLATSYTETGQFTKALEVLDNLIQKDPSQKKLYLERAALYFELGEIDLGLEDYLRAGKRKKAGSLSSELLSFSSGLSEGIVQGGVEGAKEFIPSTLGSLSGIGEGLWAFAKDPVNISVEFVESAYSCIEFIKDHTPKEILLVIVPELQDLIEKWDDLSYEKKGDMTGHVIGKYGVDIFSGAAFLKGVKAYRNLKRANNLLTFEMAAASERNRLCLKELVQVKKERRRQILQSSNLTIHPGKQGKHLIGHVNYDSKLNKSILTHPNPQSLIDKYAGTGLREFGTAGKAGYKEVVDFNEYIGYYVHEITGENILSKRGKIHYAKDGVHIVPALPHELINR